MLSFNNDYEADYNKLDGNSIQSKSYNEISLWEKYKYYIIIN